MKRTTVAALDIGLAQDLALKYPGNDPDHFRLFARLRTANRFFEGRLIGLQSSDPRFTRRVVLAIATFCI